jgi:hypothetical protein
MNVVGNRLCVLALIGCARSYSAPSSDWYVAPDGARSNQGSQESPLDLQSVLENSANRVHPGDRVWLRGGVYHAPTVDGFASKLAGLPASPIVVRGVPGGRVIIDASGTQFGLAIYGAFTWFWGLEVADLAADHGEHRGTPSIAYGVAVYGEGVKCVNMIVHDTAQGFSAYDKAKDSEFYGNIVYYNGYAGADRQHGHGLYLQNSDGSKWVADNIVGDNFDEGIQIYGSGSANVRGFRITGNVLYNTSSFPGYNYQYNLVIAGGAVRKDIEVSENYSFFTPARDYGFVNFGQYTPGEDISIHDNVFVGGYAGVSVESQAGPVRFSGNRVFVRPSSVQMVNLKIMPGLSLATYQWDGNTYYGLNRFFFGRNMSFEEWKAATGFDRTSSMQPSSPRGTWVFLRKNRYEPKRATLVVYNWDHAADVLVDVSQILKHGDRYVVRDAQNYFGVPLVSGTATASQIKVPLTSNQKAAPVKWKAPDHTAPDFGVFIITGN